MPPENEGLGDLEGDGLEDFDMASFDCDDDQAETEAASPADDTPVVRFVNKMLLDAVKRGVSDIHFEPYASSYRVRFRTDGILQQVSAPPARLGKTPVGPHQGHVGTGHLRAPRAPGRPH